MEKYKKLFNTELCNSEYNKTHKSLKVSNNIIYMLETSMSTMMGYVKNNGIGILTAFRGDYSFDANYRRHELLKAQFRKRKIKVIEVDGFFVENYGTSNERHVQELSLAVPFFPNDWKTNITESSGRERSNVPFGSDADLTPLERFSYFLLKAGSIFNQDCVIIALPKIGVYLHFRTGRKTKIGTIATQDKIGEAYTRLRYGKDKGRTFIFEGTRTPHNHVDAYKLLNEGILF